MQTSRWALVVIGTVALIAVLFLFRYQYDGRYPIRVDRWTGQLQKWACVEPAIDFTKPPPIDIAAELKNLEAERAARAARGERPSNLLRLREAELRREADQDYQSRRCMCAWVQR